MIRDYYLQEILSAVEPTLPGWRLDGEAVMGPGTLAIRVGDHDSADHGPGVSHLDVVVVLNRERPDAPVIIDCATGAGNTEAAQAAWAVGQWANSTWPVVLELLRQTGEHAGHYGGSDPGGLPGWHVIHGPFGGWGRDGHPDQLARWLVDHPVLPSLAPALEPTLHGQQLAGVRLFLGGNGSEEIAEVQVNGHIHQAASEALASLEWPRPEGLGYVRAFVLALHEIT